MEERPAPTAHVVFKLRLASSAGTPVFIYEANDRFTGWVRVAGEGGEPVAAFDDAYLDQCTACGSGMSQGQVVPDTYELQPGEERQATWRHRWEELGCWYGPYCDVQRWIEPGPYSATFCWGATRSTEWPHIPQETTCHTVPFVVPDQGSVVVEHTIGG
ncbi:hypothetical protein [Vulgatibacter sp.]|uniref:hypothetical protein n=1 Tax=Vulgatibacter sp. TaxID=1971226 RepID=UPI0035677898